VPRVRRAGILRLIPHFRRPGQRDNPVQPPSDPAFAPPAPDGENSGARRALRGHSTFEQRVAKGASKASAWAQSVATSFGRAFDIDRNIDKLTNPGDTYTVLLNGEAYVEAGLYGTDDIDVSRDQNGKYIVAGGGEIGAGLWGQLGGQLGAKLDAQALATVGAGVRSEMTFDTAADAKKAAHILAREQQATLLAGAFPSAAALAPLLKPSPAEEQFLHAHVSALSLYGDAIADLNAVAGLNTQGLVQAGLFGDTSATGQTGVRLELDHGRVTGLTLQHQLLGDVNLGVGLKLGQGDTEGWTSGLLGGDANAQVTTEMHFSAPPDDGAKAPSGYSLAALRRWIARAHPDVTTVTVDLNATAGGSGQTRGMQLETRLEGDPKAIVASGAITSALHGHIQQAMNQAGRAIKVEVTKTPFAQDGINVNPGVSLMGVGLECTVTAQTQLFKPPVQEASNENT
jgi:hypothetical protein